MQLEEAGWGDINERLAASDIASSQLDALASYLTHGLVGHFGADTVTCSHGKGDSTHHSMSEVAAASLAHLTAVLRGLPAPTLERITADLTPSTPPPWSAEWHDDRRTSTWRT